MLESKFAQRLEAAVAQESSHSFRMLTAIENCKKVIQEATQSLMKANSGVIVNEKHYEDKLPEPVVASQTDKTVIIFNPLPYPREEVICIHVSSPSMSINDEIIQQINPVFNLDGNTTTFIDGTFEVRLPSRSERL